VEPGTKVQPGQVVAVVDGNGRSAPVHAHVGGRLGGSLAKRHVSRGEGVAWLSR
jgi:murein DD-endopeptidase MepM/ murein hydrolase activator NlpD